MASDEVVRRLLIEMDGNNEKLRRVLLDSEGRVKKFGSEADKAGRSAGAGADVVVNKQANAARAIASATETIARQGKVSGEAAKQLIAQGANAALFFGPQGAIVGAIGIATLAMVGMFTRVKRELAETERRTLEVMNRFAEMDATAQAKDINRLVRGPHLKGTLGTSEEALSIESLIATRGLEELERDRARLAAQVAAGNQRFRAGMGAGATTEQREAVAALETQRAQLKAVEAAISEGNKQLQDKLKLLGETGAESARTALAVAGYAEATKAATEAERERKQALRELNKEAADFGRDVERMLLSSMGSAAEKVAAPFDELIARGRKLIADGKDIETNRQRIADLERDRDVAVEVTNAIAASDAMLQRFAANARMGLEPASSAFAAVNARLAHLRDLLRDAIVDSDRYKQILAEIVRLERERATMVKGIADANNIIGKPKDDVAEMARELQQAVDGALQLAIAFGAVGDEVGDVLRGISQIAGNIPALQKALEEDSEGNIDGLGVVSAALPIAGAIASIGAALFGTSPEEKQRREELRRNTEAIKDLTKKAGALGIGVSGTEAGAAASGLDAFLGDQGSRKLINAFGHARDVARGFGLDLDELDEIAKKHGITLNNSIDSWIQLQEALGLTITKLGEFDTSLEAQKAQAEAEISIMGITDPLEQLRIRQGAVAGRSSRFDAVTAGLDLSTAEGREQARKNAQILFETMKAGGGTLTKDDLDDLDGDELVQALLDLTAGLDAIDSAAGTGSGGSSSGTIVGLRSLTEATGSRLEDRFRSLDVKASAAQETRIAMLGALMQIANAVLPVPAIPSGFALARASAPAGAAAAPTIIIEGFTLNINVPAFASGAEAASILNGVTDGMEAAINEAVYRATLREQRIRGDLRLSV